MTHDKRRHLPVVDARHSAPAGTVATGCADSGACRASDSERVAQAQRAASEAGFTPLSIGFVSLGCPKNLVDSEVMLGRLQASGHEIVADAKAADVIVVNTCAFIDRAKQESIDTILEMAREKQQGRARRLVVTGCLAQRYDGELRREIPEIDASLGTGQVEDILKAVTGEETHVDAAAGLPTWVYDHQSPRLLSTPSYMAYLKISEGCDYTCSFCIIPTLRGRHRSRGIEDVAAEAEALAARGVKELVLVAQDSTRYGLDLGLRDGLARLLRRLGRIDGVRWIRVMYAYPATVTDAVLEAIASEEKVAKYIDIPLQHASQAVLQRMKRPTGRGNLLGLVEKMRAKVPGVALRSSFIVGFPGESEADFAELLRFLEAAQFDNVGVFTFSDEEGTSSFELADRVPQRTKEARKRKLLALQKKISLRRNRARVGQRLPVLVEGPHPESELLLRGRLEGQAAEIDGAVLITDSGERALRAGDFVTCQITGAHPYDLEARVVA
ncbi:MAG: 30S ribosomal protein S12 methylthiotransferase RimO [Vicinamibacteria bacterium]